jgi:hypothetical protein
MKLQYFFVLFILLFSNKIFSDDDIIRKKMSLEESRLYIESLTQKIHEIDKRIKCIEDSLKYVTPLSECYKNQVKEK